MNLSAAIMLFDETVRPVRVEYDPDNKYNNQGAMKRLFKTIDASIKKDDLVVVPTTTRHGFTIAKVTEVDFVVDFSNAEEWDWIAQKFDKLTFDDVVRTESGIKAKVAKAEENKMRTEMLQTLGMKQTDIGSLRSMLNGSAQIEAPVTEPAAPPAVYKTPLAQRTFDDIF